jgi:hypothetical protein
MHMTEKMSIKEAVEKFLDQEAKIIEQLNCFDLRQGKRWCLHCEKYFEVKDIKVQIEMYDRPKNKVYAVWLACPNGKCNGSPIDWLQEKEGLKYEKK